jgi:hypothetical protein
MTTYFSSAFGLETGRGDAGQAHRRDDQITARECRFLMAVCTSTVAFHAPDDEVSEASVNLLIADVVSDVGTFAFEHRRCSSELKTRGSGTSEVCRSETGVVKMMLEYRTGRIKTSCRLVCEDRPPLGTFVKLPTP